MHELKNANEQATVMKNTEIKKLIIAIARKCVIHNWQENAE